ncbi:MAG TPA: NHLP bacteriocin export ABC transporter permease/ATPase subunit [Chloroflexia bacterium]|nr:NHLP bacteriocin export ABC transporter permease/ATPase subunit [Chloroflexia bacterium]
MQEIETFPTVLSAKGEVLTTGGNTPFLLDDPQVVWLVQTGKVELFAVKIGKDNQIKGTRYHIGSIEAGQLIFGLDSRRYGEGLGLIGVGASETRLIKLPVSHLHELALDLDYAANVAALVDNWLALLSADLIKELITPRTNMVLESGVEVELAATGRTSPRKEGVWISFLEGQSLFLGGDPLEIESPSIYFPLYGNTWIQAQTKCRLATSDSLTLLQQEQLWPGLAFFHQVYFQFKAVNIRLLAFDEINRLHSKAEHDMVVGHNAIDMLSSVLDKESAITERLRKTAKDPLLTACHLIGAAQGITFQAPPERSQEDSERRTDPLQLIIQASRLHKRQVNLTDDWWRRDNGPMLGFRKADGQPVALLPLSARAYEVIDPVTGVRQKLDQKLAGDYEQRAYVFYRPFPQKVMSARDLFMFGTKGGKSDVALALILGVVGGLAGLVVPLITNLTFDSIIPAGQPADLWQILIGLVVIALATAAFVITRSIIVLRLESKLNVTTQAGLWDRLMSLPASFFRNYTAGDLAARAMGLDAVRSLVSTSASIFIMQSLFGFMSLLLLFVYSWQLALIALVLVMITIGVIVGVNYSQLPYQRKQYDTQGRLSGLVLQLISGIAKLRVAGAETRAFAVWAKEFSQQRRLASRVRVRGISLMVFSAIWPLVTLMFLFIAVDAFHINYLSTGSFLAFLSTFIQLLVAMVTIAAAASIIFATIPTYEGARVILQTLPEVQTGSSDPGELSGSIEVNQVYFRYNQDGPYILDGVSLQIKPGQFVAIVGPSGSGKSSLLRLLLGFDVAEQGSVYYDKQDLAGLDSQAIRRQLGVVIQNGKLMAGDIFSNIVGSGSFTSKEAWEAAEMVGFAEDIKKMPMGMYTLVSEGGSTLSGGQRQRLMLARALIGKPRIVLLDEATSALDNETQAIVTRSLESQHTTRVVIAHRLSTVMNADCIYVLQNGKIAQAGSYTELMAQPGPFQELAARQLA